MNKVSVLFFRSTSFIILLLLFQFSVFAQNYDETGGCSYYADNFQGHGTASGEKYSKDLLTAAHKTLPFNTLLRVTNLRNNKSVIVRVNDRGPYIQGRIIDISGAAAREIGMISSGVVQAHVEYVGMANADSVKQALQQNPVTQPEKKNDTTAAGNKQADQTQKNPKAQETQKTKTLFYDQDYKECRPKGFGVQVGTYVSNSNCRNAMHEYEAKYQARAFMGVDKKGKVMLFRLVMGQFKSKESAESLRALIKKDIPDCFIVSYSAL
jgi:rare lipoprotein A